MKPGFLNAWGERLDPRQRNVIMVMLLVLGIGLMVGAPLLAEDPPHATQTEGHAVEGHAADSPAVEGHATGGHADGAHAAEGHGDLKHGETGLQAAEHGEGGMLHFPTLVRLVADVFETSWRKNYNESHSGETPLKLPGQDDGHGGKYGLHSKSDARSPVARFMWHFEDVIYSGIIILLLSVFFIAASRRLSVHPGKLQNLAEMIVGGLDGFIREVLGPHGRQFVPFLGTLGLYVYVMNIFGLIPLMKSPTSILETTAAMSITVFLYVQFTAIRMNGPLKYLHHLAGEPRDAIGWGMSPLMLPLHIIGEIAKPLSLALRLFGNIMGEDLLLVVFAGLGVSMLSFAHLPIGVPLHLPFIFLALLTTMIQALVFMLLSTIYISLVLPHDDHH